MSAMPDAGRVEGCLRSNGPRLSPACYAVFNPEPAETTASMPRARIQRDVQRQPNRRDDERREYRRDDGFGAVRPRDDVLRPPSRGEDD